MQERFEASAVGRIALSALLIFTLFGIVVWNLPGSILRTRLAPVVNPYFEAAGLDQGWGVFAPDPRRVTIDLFARLDYADGTEVVWRYPLGNPVVATYRTYRWQKWSEHVTLDVQSLLGPAADWLAQTQLHDGEHPVRVVLVERSAPTPPPDTDTPLKWQEQTLYTWTSPSVPTVGL